MTGKKILLIVVIVLVVAGVIVGTVLHSRSDVPSVTTARPFTETLYPPSAVPARSSRRPL